MLALVAEGLPNKLIARKLEISDKTVKAHLTRIFRELGVDDLDTGPASGRASTSPGLKTYVQLQPRPGEGHPGVVRCTHPRRNSK